MDIVTEIDMVFPIGSATGKTISIPRPCRLQNPSQYQRSIGCVWSSFRATSVRHLRRRSAVSRDGSRTRTAPALPEAPDSPLGPHRHLPFAEHSDGGA